MIEVIQLPPRDYCRTLVNLESRYGICSLLDLEIRALITLPRQDKDRLIFFASYKVSPSAPDLDTF